MGSLTYNFLADSFLFSEDLINTQFKSISDSKIEQELESYREYCMKNFDGLLQEISNTESALKVFSTIDEFSVEFLTQTALYIEQFIISDPLFKLTEKSSPAKEVMSDYLGFQKSKIDRGVITSIVKQLKRITPFIVNDYVKILPFNILFESPQEVPIKFTKNYYSDILPKDILEYFQNNAIVSSLEKSDNGWIIKDKLSIGRAIKVSFKNDDPNRMMIYFLLETITENFNENKNIITFRQTLPETLPSQEYFDAWVKQSINSTAKAFFDRIYLENHIAAKINSTIMCNSNFTANLLEQNFNSQQTIQTFSANQLINLDLPFIQNIDLNELMAIRRSEEDVFTNFRIELERNFRDLRCLTDVKEIKYKKENILHELNSVQTNRINRRFEHIKKQLGINSTILLGSLLGASITNGFSLLASIYTIAKGYKTYNDYMNNIKENPSYLLWRAIKK